MVTRARLKWMKVRMWGIFTWERFLLKMKEWVDQTCAKLAMLHGSVTAAVLDGSETMCVRENEVAVFQENQKLH